MLIAQLTENHGGSSVYDITSKSYPSNGFAWDLYVKIRDNRYYWDEALRAYTTVQSDECLSHETE